MFFVSYTLLYCLLLQVQRRCHLLFRKVANYIQESVYSKRILSGLMNNMGKIKEQEKIGPRHKSYFGNGPRNSGTDAHLIINWRFPPSVHLHKLGRLSL